MVDSVFKSAAMAAWKGLGLVVGIGICWILLILPTGIFSEGYNPFYPYADTSFALGFEPEDLEQIHLGMELGEAWPEPLSKYTEVDSSNRIITRLHFSGDGKLRADDRQNGLIADMAWYECTIEVDADNIVLSINQGWRYD